MPPPPPPNHYSEHGGRIAQMTKQEAIIANKRQELLEKKKNAELARQVAAAQLGTPIDSTTTKTRSVTFLMTCDMRTRAKKLF